MQATGQLEKAWTNIADKIMKNNEIMDEQKKWDDIRKANHTDSLRVVKNVLDPEPLEDHKYFCMMFEAQHYPYKFVSQNYSQDMI